MAEYDFEEQHPIPTDIASYQFRLVGDMTLKQFMQVAAGVVTGLILYSTPLHPFIKWPLILFSVLFGIALAFMPLDDRPLGTWIIIFFRSIYSPTLFIYKKSGRPYHFFQTEGALPTTAPAGIKFPPVAPATTPAAVAPPPAITKPEEEKKEEGIVYTSIDEGTNKALSELEQKEKSYLSKVTHLFSMPNLSQKTSDSVEVKPVTFTYIPDKPEVLKSTPKEKAKENKKDEVEDLTTIVAPTLGRNATITGKKVEFVREAAPPIPPSKENVIVGQVIDTKGSIVEGAILEIKDSEDRPVRALRTNKLGHFMTVTPLSNGDYKIIIEKEGYVFEPEVFKAEGKIIPPISIKAEPVKN